MSVLCLDAPVRLVRVVFSNGQQVEAEIQGTEDAIARHFLDNEFPFEDGSTAWGVAIDFLA